MEATLKQKTAKGLFWGSISGGVQQLITVVLGIFMARILSPDDYGLVGMLAIFSGIAATTINSGFSAALTNKRDANHADFNAVFWFTVVAGILLYLILFVCAPLIAEFYKRPELTNLSRVVFLSFLFAGVSTTSYTVLFKQLNAKRQAQIDMISVLVGSSVGVGLAIYGFTYWALALQLALQSLLGAVLRLLIAPWKPTWKLDFSPLKPMLSFSTKLYFTSIFSQIAGNIFSLLLGKFYGATQLGYYSQGQKWMGMGHLFISGMFNSISQPVLAQINDEKERQVSVVRKLIRFGAFVSFPLMLGLAFIGEEFILIVVGEKWLPSVPFLQIFCVWGAAGFLWTIYINLIVSVGKSNIYMRVVVITGLLQMIPSMICMFFWGILMMTACYVFMTFAGILLCQYYAKKLIGLRLRDVLNDVFPYLAATLFCFASAWLLTRNIQNLNFLLASKVLISGILYVFVLKITRSVIFEESVDFIRKSYKK
ncbi:polysaccharide biosynthesis protein [Candidatus Symbiothrix dinenymphae]|nr:polysaccharide biosynthesis protein [Candidatus Symbiothrix dinenymphae]